MTALLDAYALIAYLRGEAAADAVSTLLWQGDTAITAVQLAEVVDRMERVYGVSADEIEVAISALGIAVLAVDYPTGVEAGRVRARHYLPTGRTLSLADCVCVAAAVLDRHTVVTADPVLLRVAEAEGCTMVELPASG